jgi:Protein of unknown function (DUF3037)
MHPKVIHYAVCKYVPDILRAEFINVGVLAHIPEDGWSEFHKTKNLKRIKSFDDEVELDVVSVLLESLEYQFNANSLSDVDNTAYIHKDYFIEEETKYYVNQIQFSEVKTLASYNVQEDLNDLYDMYLYYDKPKSDRINTDRVRRLVSKMFTNSAFKSSINRRPSTQNLFKQYPFDFSINLKGEETLIKVFSFDYKKFNHLFSEVKSFLYDVNHFKRMDINNIKVVINNTDFDKEFEQIALSHLKEELEVYTLQEFAEYINKAEAELTKGLWN